MHRKPIIWMPGEGRTYPAGRMAATFKADLEETAAQYSVSEWWLEPGARLPNEHAHSEDHVYYIIEGTLSVTLDGEVSHVPAGGYVLIPGGTPHAFANETGIRAGFISFNVPGGFEERMPAIAGALAEEQDTGQFKAGRVPVEFDE